MERMRHSNPIRHILLFLIIFSTISGFQFFSNSDFPAPSKLPISEHIPNSPDHGNLNTQSTIISNGMVYSTGISGNASLSCNRTGLQTSFSSNQQLEIELPNPWSIIYTNITIRELRFGPLIVEDTITSNYQDTRNGIYAMQINMSLFSRLSEFSIYLYDVHKVTELIISIYNATQQASLPSPHISLYTESTVVDNSADYSWHNFILTSPVELDPLKTYGDSFFIVLNAIVDPGGKFQWGYALDSQGTDYGAAYQYVMPNWNLLPWDFNLKVDFVNSSCNPSQIGLHINDTAVTDGNLYEGEWISHATYSGSEGRLVFQFSAAAPASFSIEWTASFTASYQHQVGTLFQGLATSDIIFWNASFSASFITNSFGKVIEIALPAWDAVMAVWNAQNEHMLWDQSIIGSTRIITITSAQDGPWIIQCNDTNYLEKVYVERGGEPVSTINSTDTVDIFCNFTEVIASGDANLTTFPLAANYNDTIGEALQNNKTIRFSPAWTPVQTATASYSSASLQVIWTNGTAAGIRVAPLTVDNVPTNLTYITHTDDVPPGESIFVSVNFTDAYTDMPLLGGTVLIKNSTDGAVWPAPFQLIKSTPTGLYEIEILTLGLLGGMYNFSVNISKPLYFSSEISDLEVTIGGLLSNISVTAPNCRGLQTINQTHALADPAPYHNSTTKVTIYYFSNDTLDPLRNGIISASWIGGGPEVSWVSAFFGYYNITIDVTGFHAGTNHTLRISIQESGYYAAILYIIVPVNKLPTRIDSLESSYSGYLLQNIDVYAIFQDTHTGATIPTVYELGGNCTIRIANFIQNMSLLSSTTGIYKYTVILSSLGLEEGKFYNITLSAYSNEHQFASVTVSLYVIPRTSVNLTLFGLPSFLLAGIQFQAVARLTTATGIPISNSPIISRFHYEPGALQTQSVYVTNETGFVVITGQAYEVMQSVQIILEYWGNMTVQNMTQYSAIIPILKLNCSLTLAALPSEILVGETLEFSATLMINGSLAINQIVIFTFTYEGSSRVDVKSAGTDDSGVATTSLKIPSGVSKVFVTVSYGGISYIIANSTTSEVAVITIMTLVWRYSPYWLLAIAVAVGAILTYQYAYKRPKLVKLTKKWQKSAIRLRDAANLNFLMIILKNVGVAIFNYSFKGDELDYQLMSGFLTAISTFQHELGKAERKSTLETGEWEINYQESKIYGINRELTQFVLILEATPSEELKDTLLKFAMDVERNFNQEFIKYKGNTSPYSAIELYVQKYFDTKLNLPHMSRDILPKELNQLEDLERQIYNFGVISTKERGYFYLSDMFNDIEQMLKVDRNHIFDAILHLVELNYFTSSKPSILFD